MIDYTKETIRHYGANATAFWEGTKDHDVNQNYAALLTRLPARTGMRLLDFGCGPGRDLLHFKNRGHEVVGIDGCEQFCVMAREYTGCEVLHQNFLELDLPNIGFDGIFANASIFHIQKTHLARVLLELNSALKINGLLFMSNPRGSQENFDGARYGNYMELDEYSEFLNNAGFEVVDHYYRPTGWPREEQPWLAMVAKKL
jgi:SAM-dependent methyltransferase